MKATCASHRLKEAVSLSERITGKNLTLPVLNSILLSAEKGKIILTATNLEIGMEISIPAKIEKEGTAAVPAKALNGLVSGILDENIKLEGKNNNLIISTKNTSSVLKGHPIDDYPSLPLVKKEHTFSLPISRLFSGLRSVWQVASLSDIKPEIASVLISSSKGNPLVFAATDSFRLAEKSFKEPVSSVFVLLLPQKSAGEIIRLLEGKEGKADFVIDKNQVAVLCDNIKFISRLTEGRFPDYKQIIPQKFSTKVTLEKDALHNILRMSSVFSSRLNELKIKLLKDQGLIEFASSNPELGEHTSRLTAEIEGEPLEVVFNHRYLLDGLQFINSKKVFMGFNGPDKPLFLRGAEDDSFYYLVMPMKNI